MIGKETGMLESMYITLDLSLQVGHTPTKVDKKKSNTE